MEIVTVSISKVFFMILYFLINFLFWGLFYRYILHPNYRWSQKGNICYDNRRDFALVCGFISAFFGLLVCKGFLKFEL